MTPDGRTKHGHATRGEDGYSPTYRSWRSMKQRALNPNTMGSEYYSKRGITVCARWRVFTNFLADLGERPEGMTLDRRNNDGSYSCGHCPECIVNGWRLNCRWATPREQVINRRPITLMTHCKAGHEMTPENTYAIPGRGRARGCRQCRNEFSRRYNARKRAQLLARSAAR